MGKLRWYKRDPHAALDGMMVLTLEERGAYNTVLDLIYARDGQVDDDDRFIAGWLRCDIRVWRRIRKRLLDLGKLYIEAGALRNSRADVEVHRGLERVASVSEVNRTKGIKSGEARRKNKEIDEPKHEPKSNTTTTTTTTRVREEEERKTLERSSSELALEPPDDYPKDYREQFCDAYPRKIARKAAFRRLEIIRKSGDVTFAALMAGVRRFAEASRHTDPKYIPYPATWLNAGRWDDDTSSLFGGQGPPGQPVARTVREQQILRAQNAVDNLLEIAFPGSSESGSLRGPAALPLLPAAKPSR